MNPLTRRRADRRRLADWAARAHRIPQSDGDAAVNGDYGAEGAGPAPVRRLPFELLDPPAVVALADDPPPGRNGSGADDAPDEQPEPPASEAPSLLQAARKALDGRDFALAGELYREALDQDPRDIAARNGLALVLDGCGEHDAALAQLDRCRAQDQDNLEVLISRCGVLGTLGRYAEAERGLRTALEREPGNAAAHFQLGLVASRRGRWRDAIPCLRQAASLDPGLSGAHFYLGEALNHMDDLPGALQAYQRAVELSPQNPKAWYGMGIVLDRMNRPDDAAQQYRRSRELQHT